MAPLLGYWKIRGLGQHIRYVLEYTGEAYDEKFYEYGPPPNYYSSWTSDKFTLDLPLPNLPYYIDGDVKITQSHAILRHIGRKHDLLGQTEKDKMMVDMLMDQGKDMHTSFAMLTYFPCPPNKVEEFMKKAVAEIKLLSTILGNQKWFTGDKITLADFIMYEELAILFVLDKNYLNDFQNLKNFMKRFEELPAIKKYLASPRCITKKINLPFAQIVSFD